MLDLPADTNEVILRLFVAAAIGACIGLDREVRRKPAGMRTHALVALGSALVTLVVVPFDPRALRVDAISGALQGIVAGVRCLGGGAVRKGEYELVSGLTARV